MMKFKNWKEIHDYWQSLAIPEINLMNFEFREHSTYSPWFEYERKCQFYHSDNPVINTGFHLVSILKNKSQEFKNAYKIFACLRYNGFSDRYDLVKEPFSVNKTNYYSWWNNQSKYIFPFYNIDNEYDILDKIKNNPRDIKLVIDYAAQIWTDISKRWALVITPDLMDSNSQEFKNYITQSKKLNDDRDYREYLRLKAKFEPND